MVEDLSTYHHALGTLLDCGSRAEDWDRYQRFLTTELTAAPNVSHVKSALAIRTSKFEHGVPV